jgi:hypothetical protein
MRESFIAAQSILKKLPKNGDSEQKNEKFEDEFAKQLNNFLQSLFIEECLITKGATTLSIMTLSIINLISTLSISI